MPAQLRACSASGDAGARAGVLHQRVKAGRGAGAATCWARGGRAIETCPPSQKEWEGAAFYIPASSGPSHRLAARPTTRRAPPRHTAWSATRWPGELQPTGCSTAAGASSVRN